MAHSSIVRTGRILGRVSNYRHLSTTAKAANDPRSARLIHDEFGVLRAHYSAPKHAIVLAHGLFGFNEYKVAGNILPAIQYWRGIQDALMANGVEVIVADVPPSGSIEMRAKRLGEVIAEKANGKKVNIIGGLDARYMISRLKPPEVGVLSLTTIATPHRGSSFADFVFDQIGPAYTPRIYKSLEKLGMETGAFSQLTRKYMTESFNPRTPDLQGVRYFSYGASLEPRFWSIFRFSHGVIKKLENAENDGLVSVPSSQWGEYKGTLMATSHIDLINWTNRLQWWFAEITTKKHNFNGVAFYLHIADMLAAEGL